MSDAWRCRDMCFQFGPKKSAADPIVGVKEPFHTPVVAEEPDPCPIYAPFAPTVRCLGHSGHKGDHEGTGADGNTVYWKNREEGCDGS